jgi:rhodanese-related sulfurtransferase
MPTTRELHKRSFIKAISWCVTGTSDTIMTAMQPQTTITPTELNRLLGTDGTIEVLDVRTPGEFDETHAPGAKLVPLDELDPSVFVQQRGGKGGKPVYILCQSGGRAGKAAMKFQQAGFTNCVVVEGGMEAWMRAGLPVIRGVGGNSVSLIRQVQIVVGIISATGAALALTVNVWFALIPLFIGCGLLFAGLTGFCGLALVLAKMPWNRSRMRIARVRF